MLRIDTDNEAIKKIKAAEPRPATIDQFEAFKKQHSIDVAGFLEMTSQTIEPTHFTGFNVKRR